MRCFVAMILTGLILSCPFVCGAAECERGQHFDHPTNASPNAPSPVHCPEDGDACVCRGAVPTSDVKVPHTDSILIRFPIDVVPLAIAHPLSHLIHDGHPAGLAGWGDSLAVRAFLQNFRC